jgi:hypothetical protein
MRLLLPTAAMLTLFAAVSCNQALPTAATGQAQDAAGVDVRASNNGQGIVLSVTGSGHYTPASGNLRTFAFEVKEDAYGGVYGTFQLIGHDQPPARWHGPLTCLSVSGNEAWIGGVYDMSTNPALLGTGFWFYVKDNGQGKNAAPDLVRRHVRSGNAEDCASQPDPTGPYLYSIEAGNIQIHVQ